MYGVHIRGWRDGSEHLACEHEDLSSNPSAHVEAGEALSQGVRQMEQDT